MHCGNTTRLCLHADCPSDVRMLAIPAFDRPTVNTSASPEVRLKLGC